MDSDSDGPEDGWERSCFGDLSRDGTLDSDGDGFSDRDEFLADTNPLNAQSRFGSEARSPAAGQVAVSWPASPGRGYRVQVKDQLDAPDWSDWQGLVTVVGRRAALLDLAPIAGTQRFYRVTLVE